MLLPTVSGKRNCGFSASEADKVNEAVRLAERTRGACTTPIWIQAQENLWQPPMLPPHRWH